MSGLKSWAAALFGLALVASGIAMVIQGSLMVSAPSFLQHNKPSKPSWVPGTQEASSNVSSAAIGIGITMIVLGLPVTYVGYRFLRWGLSKI
jgi:hypothetical protein